MSLDRFLSQVVPVRQKLYRFAFRLLGNEEDAQDITQDAMMKVWDMQEKMAELQNMEAWCMRITRNTASCSRVVSPSQYSATNSLIFL
jgi:RNA polymerase sigma-70 factor (ECF subfamily)